MADNDDYKSDDGDAAGDNEAEILAELRERYDYASTQWDPIYAEGDTDIKYLTGDTWDENDRKARKGRLSLKFDQLNQYLNQLVNAIRQNKRAVKVTPEGNGANDKTAEVRANRIRQIEYLSNAPEVYTAAFSGAAERSYGYARIVAEWERRSFNKCLRLKSIPNPSQVLPDPDDQSVTGRGWHYLFFRYPMARKEFQRKYPHARTGTYVRDAMLGIATCWGDEHNVLVCEYWDVKLEKKTLYRLGIEGGPSLNVYEDDVEAALAKLPPGSTILAQREDQVPVVCQYLTNGIELLSERGKPKKTEWKGSTIPFIACYGKILYRNDEGITKKIILSFIRLARDAQKYYNWLKSTEGEVIAMPPKTPYFAYRGQLNVDELALIEQSVSQPVAVITAGATSEITGQQVLPLPRREMPDPPIQAYEIAAEAARRDIQNALGRYSASVGRADTNVKSGVALEKLDQQSDQGSYHFVDNFDAFVREVGVKLDELLEFYDDTMKDLTVRLPNDEVEQQRVNDPNDPDSVDMSQGDHVVTISTGPDFDSERAVANAFADALVGGMDQIARIVGPKAAAALLGLSIKLKNIGPLGDAMEQIVTPPEFKKDGAQNPQAAQQERVQLLDRLKEAEGVMQQMHAELQKEKEGNATELQKAEIDKSRAIEVAKIQFASAANVADIKANLEHSLQLMTTQIAALEAQMGQQQAAQDRAHDAESQMVAQQHERDMAAQQAVVQTSAEPTT